MKNADIKKMLKNDVKWAVRAGHKIDMRSFGTEIDFSGDVEKYKPKSAKCGLCAVGSHLARNETVALNGAEIYDFARVIRRSDSFTEGLVSGTDPLSSKEDAKTEASWFDSGAQGKAFMEGFKVGREVLNWVTEQKKLGKL